MGGASGGAAEGKRAAAQPRRRYRRVIHGGSMTGGSMTGGSDDRRLQVTGAPGAQAPTASGGASGGKRVRRIGRGGASTSAGRHSRFISAHHQRDQRIRHPLLGLLPSHPVAGPPTRMASRSIPAARMAPRRSTTTRKAHAAVEADTCALGRALVRERHPVLRFAAYNGVDCGTCFQIQFTGKGQYNDKDPGSVAINGKTMDCSGDQHRRHRRQPIRSPDPWWGVGCEQRVHRWFSAMERRQHRRHKWGNAHDLQGQRIVRFSRCARPRSATCRSSWQAAIGSTAGSLRRQSPDGVPERLPARPRSAPSREVVRTVDAAGFTTRHAQYCNEMPRRGVSRGCVPRARKPTASPLI